MNTITCLLITSLLFLATVSSKKDEEEQSKSKSDEETCDEAVVTNKNGTIYNFGRCCILPCRVERTNPDRLQAPRVSWFLKSFRGKYVSLSDSERWEADYEHQRCANNQPQRRDFSDVHSNFECKVYGENGFKCDLILDRCETGTFRCDVEFEDEPVVQKHVSVDNDPNAALRGATLPICFHPTASNFSSRYLSNPSSGEVPRIEVVWNSSSKKDFSPDCSPKNCRMSRQYEVQMLVYNTVPFDESTPRSQVTEWEATRKKRATNQTFDYPDSIEGKYFMFKVRNSRPRGFAPHISDLEQIQIATSQIFYFGEQEKAKLTEPLQNETHTVARDMHHVITCSGTGKPSPNINITVERDGEIVGDRGPAISSYDLSLVVDYPTTVVYCEASNYVVNEQGAIERVVDVRTITVNMAP